MTTMSPCSTVSRRRHLHRIGPALARLAAAARRVEFLAVAERGRQFSVGAPVERDRLLHFFARIAIGVERDLRRRAHALAGPLVFGEAVRRRRERDREIIAVAGAHADGAEVAAHLLLLVARGERAAGAAAEQAARGSRPAVAATPAGIAGRNYCRSVAAARARRCAARSRIAAVELLELILHAARDRRGPAESGR